MDCRIAVEGGGLPLSRAECYTVPMTPEVALLILAVVLVLLAVGALVRRRRGDAARRRSQAVEARAWAQSRIDDLEARKGVSLPGPDANHDPDLAALRERFVQSIEDGDENPNFWGTQR